MNRNKFDKVVIMLGVATSLVKTAKNEFHLTEDLAVLSIHWYPFPPEGVARKRAQGCSAERHQETDCYANVCLGGLFLVLVGRSHGAITEGYPWLGGSKGNQESARNSECMHILVSHSSARSFSYNWNIFAKMVRAKEHPGYLLHFMSLSRVTYILRMDFGGSNWKKSS